jgi:hypothetical protein
MATAEGVSAASVTHTRQICSKSQFTQSFPNANSALEQDLKKITKYSLNAKFG